MFHKVGTAAVIVVLGIGTVLASVRPPQNALASSVIPTSPIGLVDRFLAPDEQPLVSYRATRRLSATTRGGRMEASIEVSTSLDPKHGFTYEIMSEEGSGTIRNKVLLAALEAEQKAVAGKDGAHMALTRDNYEFTDVTDGRDNLMKVGIKPLRKHAMLIAGSVFLEGGTG